MVALDVLAFLLQESTGPDETTWLAILTLVGGATSAMFGAMLWSQRKVDSNREQELKKCEDRETKRVERAEGQTDRCNERLAAQTTIINDQTAALREFGGLIKDVAASSKENIVEGRRYAERLESNAKEIAALRSEITELKRLLNELAYSLRDPNSHRRTPGAE